MVYCFYAVLFNLKLTKTFLSQNISFAYRVKKTDMPGKIQTNKMCCFFLIKWTAAETSSLC